MGRSEVQVKVRTMYGIVFVMVVRIAKVDSKIHGEYFKNAVVGLYEPPGHEFLPSAKKHHQFIYETRYSSFIKHPAQMMEFDPIPVRIYKNDNPVITILDVDFENELERMKPNSWKHAKDVNIRIRYPVVRLRRNRFKNRYIRASRIRNTSNYYNL